MILELEDELFGFYPGAQGSTAFFHTPARESDAMLVVATKYAVDEEDDVDGDGWQWGLGATRLNRKQVESLRDSLTQLLEGSE